MRKITQMLTMAVVACALLLATACDVTPPTPQPYEAETATTTAEAEGADTKEETAPPETETDMEAKEETKEESEEETTTAHVVENVAAKEKVAAEEALGSMSSQLLSFEFMLNGQHFTLPFPYSQVNALGWQMEVAYGDLPPFSRSFRAWMDNGSESINVSIGNLTPNTITLDQGLVGLMSVNSRTVDRGTAFILPGGITIGSTMEEIVAAHGQPSSYLETIISKTITYQLSPQEEIQFTLSLNDLVVTEVTMTNFTPREGTLPAVEPPSPDAGPPEVVRNYTPPQTLGNDWTRGIVSLNGVIYQLPIPIAALVANGWEMDSEDVVLNALGTRVGVVLRYGSQVMRVGVRNYDRFQQPLSHSFVTDVSFSNTGWQGDIILPGGITPNSTHAEVMAAFGPYSNFSTGLAGNTYTFGESMWQEIAVRFDGETHAILGISVTRYLRDLYW